MGASRGGAARLPLCVTSLCISASRSGLRLPAASLVLWFVRSSRRLLALSWQLPPGYLFHVCLDVRVIGCVTFSLRKPPLTPFAALAPLQTYICLYFYSFFFSPLLPFINAQAQGSVHTHRSRCNFKLPESA